jgi:hypothetical protein
VLLHQQGRRIAERKRRESGVELAALWDVTSYYSLKVSLSGAAKRDTASRKGKKAPAQHLKNELMGGKGRIKNLAVPHFISFAL